MNALTADVTLEGQRALLRPLQPDDAGPLGEAVKDGELWKLWYTNVPSPEDMAAEIDRRLAQRQAGVWMPFAIVELAGGQPVGMTNYMNIEASTPRLEIGATWYRASAQRTGLNTECKRLLLAHAFEVLDCLAVEFRTHFFNHQSRRAIERLGAKLDGIIRNHTRSREGLPRDTCVYSIIAGEWPTVKRHLDFQLERPR